MIYKSSEFLNFKNKARENPYESAASNNLMTNFTSNLTLGNKFKSTLSQSIDVLNIEPDQSTVLMPSQQNKAEKSLFGQFQSSSDALDRYNLNKSVDVLHLNEKLTQLGRPKHSLRSVLNNYAKIQSKLDKTRNRVSQLPERFSLNKSRADESNTDMRLASADYRLTPNISFIDQSTPDEFLTPISKPK